jgi:hypothetical protein
VGESGAVLLTTVWDFETGALDPRTPDGNLFLLEPEAEAPRLLGTPELRFHHVGVSRCGTYFVADAYPAPGTGGAARIVVGHVGSGRWRTLVSDARAGFLAPSWQQAHAYLTPDLGAVVHTAWLGDGPAQVCLAEIPEGFLEALV